METKKKMTNIKFPLPFSIHPKIPYRIIDANGHRILDVVDERKYPDIEGTRSTQIPLILACLNKEVDGFTTEDNIVIGDNFVYIYSIPLLHIRAYNCLTNHYMCDDYEAEAVVHKFKKYIIKRLVKKN